MGKIHLRLIIEMNKIMRSLWKNKFIFIITKFISGTSYQKNFVQDHEQLCTLLKKKLKKRQLKKQFKKNEADRPGS